MNLETRKPKRVNQENEESRKSRRFSLIPGFQIVSSFPAFYVCFG